MPGIASTSSAIAATGFGRTGRTASEKEDPLTPADVYEDGLVVAIPKWQKWARVAKRKLDQAALER